MNPEERIADLETVNAELHQEIDDLRDEIEFLNEIIASFEVDVNDQ